MSAPWTPYALATVLCAATAPLLLAKPVSLEQAQQAIQGWRGRAIQQLEAVPCPEGLRDTPLCYLAHFQEGGYAVVSPDDELPPVIAFSPTGTLRFQQANPFCQLLQEDLSARLSYLHALGTGRTTHTRNQATWAHLVAAGSTPLTTRALPLEWDERVSPLTRTLWNQKTNQDEVMVFNVYTPKNYACGCVATALGQLIRHHTWPKQGIGRLSFEIFVDGDSRTAITRGGDNQGGPYRWDLMPENPVSLDRYQIHAIGAFLHDVGLSLNMSYTDEGSGTNMVSCARSLRDVFKFASAAVHRGIEPENACFIHRSHANLDAGFPCMISARGMSKTTKKNVGHGMIVDGYAYNGDNTYYHINMGWGGTSTAWYTFPDMDTYKCYFNELHDLIYNIYPNNKGYCLTGRVLDQEGDPLAGAKVSVGNVTSTTNEKGTFAFLMGCQDTVTLKAQKEGFSFEDKTVTVRDNLCDQNFQAKAEE